MEEAPPIANREKYQFAPLKFGDIKMLNRCFVRYQNGKIEGFLARTEAEKPDVEDMVLLTGASMTKWSNIPPPPEVPLIMQHITGGRW